MHTRAPSTAPILTPRVGHRPPRRFHLRGGGRLPSPVEATSLWTLPRPYFPPLPLNIPGSRLVGRLPSLVAAPLSHPRSFAATSPAIAFGGAPVLRCGSSVGGLSPHDGAQSLPLCRSGCHLPPPLPDRIGIVPAPPWHPATLRTRPILPATTTARCVSLSAPDSSTGRCLGCRVDASALSLPVFCPSRCSGVWRLWVALPVCDPIRRVYIRIPKGRVAAKRYTSEQH